MKNLIVHVGFPKSGSSAIQKELRENVAVLNAAGIGYPLLDARETAAIELRGYSSGNAVFIVEALKKNNGTLPDLLAKIEECPEETVILSTEAYGQLDAQTMRPFIDWLGSLTAQVRLIAYQRSPFDLVLSGYSQAVKVGRMTKTLDYSCHGFTDPQVRIREAFAGMQIEEFAFDDCKHDLTNDFLQRIGAGHVALPAAPARTNRSITIEEAHVIKQLNASGLSNRDIEAVVVRLLQTPAVGTPMSHTAGSIEIMSKRLGLDPQENMWRVPDGQRASVLNIQKVSVKVINLLARKTAKYRKQLDIRGVEMDDIFNF